ncbi:MAG: hypothetical protein ACRD3W_29100, partial [Terriglobales bacterium]
LQARAELLCSLKQYAAARTLALKLVALPASARDSWPLALLGRIDQASGDYKRACDDYCRAIKIEPGNGHLYGCRADLYDKLKRPELAQKDRDIANQQAKQDLLPDEWATQAPRKL